MLMPFLSAKDSTVNAEDTIDPLGLQQFAR